RATHGGNHLQNRCSAPISTIERRACAAAPQIAKRRRMRLRKIADMNVVSDAGSVGRRVVGSEYGHLGTFADCSFARDFYEMGGGRRCLSGAQAWISARNIEVAQYHEPKPVRRPGVVQHDLR